MKVGAPPTNVISDLSDNFVGLFVERPGELPPLQPIAAFFRTRGKSTQFHRRRNNGDIIINPMGLSKLEFNDKYVVKPGHPSKNVMVDFAALSMRSQPVPNHCNRVLMEHNGRLRADVPVTGNVINDATYRAVYKRADSSAFELQSQRLNLSALSLTVLNDRLREQISSLQRDKGMVTSVVGDTRAGTYDILTDIVEARSTLELIFSCVIRVLREYTNVKKRIAKRPSLDPRRRKSIWDESADEWLQFRYGITPTIMSLNSAIQWWTERDYEYAKFRGTTSFSHTFNLGDLKITVPLITDRAFGKVRVDGATARLKINPIATALELVPLSFILNWVCNIGDFVSSIWPPQGVDDEKYSYSRSIVETNVPAMYRGEECSFTLGYYQITPITPIESLALTLDWNVTWKRMLDAFALVYGPLKRSVLNPT